jgi:hypothetical protein
LRKEKIRKDQAEIERGRFNRRELKIKKLRDRA